LLRLKEDLAGFQDILKDAIAKLESERKPSSYYFGVIESH
jgi:hypothetical protein